MKIFFIRHGESMSNAGLVVSRDDSQNGLTALGRQQIEQISRDFKEPVSAIYTSPYLRTRLSAQIFVDNTDGRAVLITDDRIKEIDHGIYAGQKDNPHIEEVARRQIAGDYEIRFGETGENKRELLTRFLSFLLEVIDTHKPDDNIVVFSHGRAIAILREELIKAGLKNVTKSHEHTVNGSMTTVEVGSQDREIIEDVYKLLYKL